MYDKIYIFVLSKEKRHKMFIFVIEFIDFSFYLHPFFLRD